jgi:REP element-mobilizing transposase RayT
MSAIPNLQSATQARDPDSQTGNRNHGHKALRKGRCSIAGQAYLLTAVTLFRRPAFGDFETAAAVARLHLSGWLWRDSRVLAWVLMPDHWHGLVVLGEQDSLATLMGRFKAVAARSVDRSQRVNGWLWSRGFHDHALRSEKDLRRAARYLVANPLRAGLVSDIGAYPFWDATWLTEHPHRRRSAHEREQIVPIET